MATAWSDNSVKVFDLKTGEEGRVYGHFKLDTPITAIATNGRYLAVATVTAHVRLFLLWGNQVKQFTNLGGRTITTMEMTNQ